MKKSIKRLGIIALAAVIGFTMITCGNDDGDKDDDDTITEGVITYPWPGGMTKYSGVTMTAEGKTIDLYSVNVSNLYVHEDNPTCDKVPVGMFDMKGTVQIEITVPSNASKVFIRPLSSGITPVVSGSKITFSITEPGQYSVEYNNAATKPANAVIIFANPIETFTGTTTVEAGIHNQNYTVNSGQTLYLKPGAIIRGKVVMNSNSKIVGRGIIDGSQFNRWSNLTLPIETYGANNIEIKGITIFDPAGWNIQLQNTSNVLIDNVKMISSRSNSDGISIQSSSNVTIQNCFIRTWDDGIVIKNYGTPNSHDITAKNCIIWTDLAQSLEIGFETNKAKKNGVTNNDPKIYNVKFEDITIFHAMHKAPVSIHNGDNANIYNITFKNITVENYQAGEGDGWNYIIDITNLTSEETGGDPEWTTETARGNIHDVLIENVKILSGKTPQARFKGSSLGGKIYNINVNNIYHGATKVNLSEYVDVGSDITVSFGGFENTEGTAAVFSNWSTFDDNESGKSSTITLVTANETINEQSFTTYRIHGTIETDGWTGLTGTPDTAALQALKTMTSFSFWALGDGKEYSVMFPTSDTNTSAAGYNHYQKTFNTANGAPVQVTVSVPGGLSPLTASSTSFVQNNIQEILFRLPVPGDYDLKIWDIRLHE